MKDNEQWLYTDGEYHEAHHWVKVWMNKDGEKIDTHLWFCKDCTAITNIDQEEPDGGRDRN